MHRQEPTGRGHINFDRYAVGTLIIAGATFALGWCLLIACLVFDLPEMLGLLAYFCSALPVIPGLLFGLAVVIQVCVWLRDWWFGVDQAR